MRREGLRLDVRRAVVRLADAAAPAWSPLEVDWGAAGRTAGWRRADRGWVMTIAAVPGPDPPSPLHAVAGRPGG